MSLNVLSLFAGIGGLELGLERAGMTTVGQVEIDPYCRRVLAKHWPEVPRHDDVRTAVDWWRAESRPAVDLICGGFPCQPVSLAGKGLAQEDERWLWPAYADVVRELRPRYVLVENVPGLANRGLSDVLGSLADLGFDAVWNRVPAAAVGAPHLRQRLFLVAADPQRVNVRVEPWRSSGQDWPSAASPGFDGATWSVADPSSTRLQGPGQLQGAGASGRPGTLVADGSGETSALADADGQPSLGAAEPWSKRDPWTPEPDVGRVAHGVPARVDRLRALGNAVVPQVAEHVGRIVVSSLGK